MKTLLLAGMMALIGNSVNAQQVVQLEYFIDIDAGAGNNTRVILTPAQEGSFTFTANLQTLPYGYHYLYTRTLDDNGKWSSVSRRVFEIIPAIINNEIVNGEYFFDVDPGVGAGTPINITTPSNSILQNFTAVVSSLPRGYHKLYNRFRDNQDRWGITSRRNIELYVSDSNAVTLFEYFYEQDPGVGSAQQMLFSPQGSPVIQSLNLPVTCADVNGVYTIRIRTKDMNGNWSLTTSTGYSLKDGTSVTTVKSGLWSDPTTWSNGLVPSASTQIILNHPITIDINATCKWLIAQCHNITVNSNVQFNITGH